MLPDPGMSIAHFALQTPVAIYKQHVLQAEDLRAAASQADPAVSRRVTFTSLSYVVYEF